MAEQNEKTRKRLQRIQRELGVGPDGLLGPETLTALEKTLGIPIEESVASLQCSRLSLDLIVSFEVGSKQLYKKRFRRPTWPGGESGVTIGIGYDLGYSPKAEIESDWGPHLEQHERAALLAVQGFKGEVSKQLARNLQQVVIPYAAAEEVFYVHTLPRYARLTRTVFKGVETLPADAQGALLSLVYNRGSKLSGETRKEMLEIRDLLDAGGNVIEAIAVQFEAMTRLWLEVPDCRIAESKKLSWYAALYVSTRKTK